ncbi:DNA primase [Agitococcus lubricus]|uniref:DNA primase n=1 Tax=Agitococcus lubricus TaxID=1077255 RepID=A0A2T5IYK9_9GAMM|nr:DNA primase [Agitococcus lubricus]PTQ89017.1 DNA primase [Agitococcus lubricus]
MAGRIPQNFIDEVLRRTDIVDVISAQVKLKKTGKNYSACCPFHHEKTPSFSVNRDKQFYHCFGCGASGNALSFVMQYERREFIDGLEYLAHKVGLSLPETSQQQEHISRQPLYDILEAAAQFYEQQLSNSPQREKAISYLQGRGITGQTAKAWRLGYAPAGWDNLFNALADSPEKQQLLVDVGLIVHKPERNSYYDALRDRIIFPIRDVRGRVIAFGGRVLDDSKPKYLNSPESPVFHKGEELYGLYEYKQAKQNRQQVMVVEGYMDVIAVHQAGLPIAVATLGTATSTTHIDKIFRTVPDLVFCFDGDNAGRKAAWRALESSLPALKEGVSASFLFLPDEHDPDSFMQAQGLANFEHYVTQSLPLADFLFNHLCEPLNLSSLEGKSKLASLAKPLIEKVPVGVYRQLLWQRLSQLTGLDESALKGAAPTVLTHSPVLDVGIGFNEEVVTPRLHPRRPTLSLATQAPTVAGRSSLSDKATQLLLQKSDAALALDLDTLRQQLPANSQLFLDVAHFCQQHPHCTSIALLGAWAGTHDGAYLKALAEDASFIPALNVEAELHDIINQLSIQAIEQQLTQATDLASQVRLKKLLHTTRQALGKAK